MSLLDLILAQKGIILSAGIAVLLLATALVLAAAGRVRGVLAQRARRARQAAAVLEQNEDVQPKLEDNPVQQVVVQQVQAPEPTQSQAEPTGVKSILQAALAPAPDSQPEPENQGAASAMKDLLSSVFGDDEETARQEALMKGLAPVSIGDLLTLTNHVADQLRAHCQANEQGA